MSFLLGTLADPFDDERLPSVFNQCIKGVPYKLMLGFYRLGGDFQGSGESLKQILVDRLPHHGWSVEPAKLMLPYVRVLKYSIGDRASIHYFEHIAPQANRKLSDLDGKEGVSVAAIPMHRAMEAKVEVLDEYRENRSFRVVTSESKPEGWDHYLRERIMECSRRHVLIAVLPELMGDTEVFDVIREVLSECDNGYPVLVAGPSLHLEEDGKRFNRMPLFCSVAPGYYVESECYHNKFSRYTEKGLSEDCELSEGMTFLVTSIGVLSFGICKDWLWTRATSTKGQEQFNQALPVLAAAPACTGSVRDVESIFSSMRDSRTIFVFCNACGSVKKMFRFGQCCAVERQGYREKMFDVRSLVVASRQWYQPSEGDARCPTIEYNGMYMARAQCNTDQTGNNEVFARMIPIPQKDNEL